MLRDLRDGIGNEVDCTRVRAWAEETLPEIHSKLVDGLRRLNLEERPLLAETPLPASNAFYTRHERTWHTVRMVIPERRLPLMEATVLGFTSDCGLKICFDRWLQQSCHESNFSLVLEPRREHRLIVIANKSLNCPFNKEVLELDEIVDLLRTRFLASLSMSGFPRPVAPETAAGTPTGLRH